MANISSFKPNPFQKEVLVNFDGGRLITPRPAVIEPQFKVGDTVRCVKKGNIQKSFGWKLNREFVVARITNNILWSEADVGGVYEESVELVTEKKIKETKKSLGKWEI